MEPTVWMCGLFVLALVVFVWGCAWSTRRKRASFEQRFPPISDAEFIERCGPGTNPRIALRVRRIVADHLGVEYDRIYPSSRFAEDLGAD